MSDSHLDRILFSNTAEHAEVLKTIECKLVNPLVDSHHDIILSEWSIQNEATKIPSKDNIVAPVVMNNRLKVLWSDSGINHYQSIVISQLSRNSGLAPQLLAQYHYC